MGASPRWKVYSNGKNYLGCAWDPIMAAAMVSCAGEGSTIRDGHSVRKVVWKEGHESTRAFESYDAVQITIMERVYPVGQRGIDAGE